MNVRTAVEERLARGEVLKIHSETPPTVSQADPWQALIGSCVADPYWDEFQIELRRIREEANRV